MITAEAYRDGAKRMVRLRNEQGEQMTIPVDQLRSVADHLAHLARPINWLIAADRAEAVRRQATFFGWLR